MRDEAEQIKLVARIDELIEQRERLIVRIFELEDKVENLQIELSKALAQPLAGGNE